MIILEYNIITEDNNIYFFANNLICSYFSTIGGLINIFFNSLSLNFQIFELAT